MQRTERNGDLNDLLNIAVETAQSRIWTALPAIVQSVDFARQTITAQPAVQVTQTLQSGERQIVNLPLLVDVPICYPKCAGFALTLPIKSGDEVLIVFGARCIDSWWQNGGTQNAPAEYRFCDLSDGFAVFAPTSQPKRLPAVSAENVQLRNTAGDVFLEITPAGQIHLQAKSFVADISGDATWNVGGAFNLTAGGAIQQSGATIQQTASSVTIDGETTVNGGFAQNGTGATFSGDVNAGGVSVKSHTHGGVKSGSDNTAAPN